MTTLHCKLIGQVAFKAGGGVLHNIFANGPQHMTKAVPDKIKGVDLHQGDHGTHGSVLLWNVTLDGKEESFKTVIQDIHDEKKQIAHKFIEGDILKQYNNFIVTFHVETKGGIDFITWTIDYELLNSDTPHPLSFLNFLIEGSKEIEAHIFGEVSF